MAKSRVKSSHGKYSVEAGTEERSVSISGKVTPSSKAGFDRAAQMLNVSVSELLQILGEKLNSGELISVGE